MKTKVILINVGGLLSEALMRCNNPFVKELLSTSVANVNSKTVKCPETHFANTALLYSTPRNYDWTVKKQRSLFNVLSAAGLKCAAVFTGNVFVANGEDSAVDRSFFETDAEGTDAAGDIIKESDFTYIYFGGAYNAARKYEYMSEEYLEAVKEIFTHIEKIRNDFPLRKMIICSDHGGHGKICYTELDSDVTIPIILSRICGWTDRFFENPNIIDIAPTVAKIFGIEGHSDWEGESLI